MDKLTITTTPKKVDSPSVQAFFKKVPGMIAAPPKRPVVFKDFSSDKKVLEKKRPSEPSQLAKSLEPVPKKTRPKKTADTSAGFPLKVELFRTREQLEAIGVEIVLEPNVMEASYGNYTNRAPPASFGMSPIPIPNTLESFVFVITGVLDSMEKDEAKKYVEACGGQVTGTVAKKTTHALVGHSCGPTKIAEIQKRGIVMVNEPNLVKLVQHFASMITPSVEPGVLTAPVQLPTTETQLKTEAYMSDEEFQVDSDDE